jgi:hypothetical protein
MPTHRLFNRGSPKTGVFTDAQKIKNYHRQLILLNKINATLKNRWYSSANHNGSGGKTTASFSPT